MLLHGHLRQFSKIRRFWTKKKPDWGTFQPVFPGSVSKRKLLPDHIPKPSYYETGEPKEHVAVAEVKTAEQIEGMRKSCKLAARILKDAGLYLKTGQSTDELDTFVHESIISHGAYPSPLNYKNFPKSVCTSINNVACHGIPDDRKLQDGDIINVDVTVYFDGFHGDCSKTFLVGNVDGPGRDLVAATEICLNESIDICKPGRKFKEIGALIERKAKKLGFQVVPVFAGHGIGHYFHGPPDIFHFNNNCKGEMSPGMTFTIEPVLTQGGQQIAILEDDWTAVTLDGARTAQFEHTVLITPSGVEILTACD